MKSLLWKEITYKIQRANIIKINYKKRPFHCTNIKNELNKIPHPSEPFMMGTNNTYIEEMYKEWKKDPSKVHKSWDVFFKKVDEGYEPGDAFIPPSMVGTLSSSSRVSATGRNEPLGLSYLIRAYQVSGHEVADLDPLELQKRPNLPQLDPKHFGFTESDLTKKIDIPENFASGVTGFLEELKHGSSLTLGKILERLRETYCDRIGVEYMHILDIEKCNWIRSKLEHLYEIEETKEKKMHILERLAYATLFERFLGAKYNTVRRFGLDGTETLIPGLKSMVDRATELGVEHIIIGMPHRGRLNVLSNVIRKPIQLIFKEFQGTHFDLEKYNKETEDWSSSGDVKYHLGTSYHRTYPDGRTVHLSLVANPSHLEAVDPVVEGKVRAKQYYLGNNPEAQKKVLPLILHGDAAFSGQGVVYETMNFSVLQDYQTGGTIHVIVNNQVGFTTDPRNARSSKYCSDLGKAFDIPIFHVNGDDPIAVVKVFELAAEWRQNFRTDVIIDLVSYRRYGHNEVDNPMFTQPLMYSKVSKMKPSLEKYIDYLNNTKVASKEECNEVMSKVSQFLSKSFEESKTWKDTSKEEWLSSKWESFKSPNQRSRIRKTGIDIETLQKVGKKICEIPETFNINKQLQRIIENRKRSIEKGEGIDWGTAEALAWGTLLLEGIHVRLSGQDVQRGTFSHRHCVLHDQKTGETYTPLNHIAKQSVSWSPIQLLKDKGLQGEFVACNSSLSEYGVLGFELGYSLENPNALIMWEAQFGDFCNGAQITIDQFISSGEDKWMRQSGLVLLLPHGYEGQGAEHSSCRIERFLQMSDDCPYTVPAMEEDTTMQIQRTNWQVVNCSTPAQYFHVLRRQVHREFRKPLISVQPKSLLRLKQASSKIEDMNANTKFQRVIPDVKEKEITPSKIRKLLICSGKLYYELEQKREETKSNDIAIIRVEQLTPFPFDKVSEEIKKYPNAEIVWAQEEPLNMGFWTYVQPRIETSLKSVNDTKRRPVYVGREPAAAPATGYHALHEAEQKQIIDKAFS